MSLKIRASKSVTFGQMVQFGTQSGNQENRASKCVTFEQMVLSGTQSGNPENRASKSVTFGQMVQSGTQSGNPENRTFKKFYGAKTGPSKNFTGPKRSLKICHFWANGPVWDTKWQPRKQSLKM